MTRMRFSFVAGILFALAIAIPHTARAVAPSLADLQAEQEAIRAESEQIGGSRSPATAENNIQTRINELQQNVDRLHDVAESLGASTQELDALRQEVGDMPIIDLGDVAQEGGEQAAERVIARTCTKAVGRAAGWVFLIGDVVEYGGKIIIRELNEDAIRDMVRSERVKLSEVYGLISQLYCQLSQERADLRRIKELRARDTALFQQIAEQRQRETERNRTGRSRAVLTRETDPAGDEAERQRALDDAVRPANPNATPVRPRQGVRLAAPTQVSSGLSPFATTILAAHNTERFAVGAMPLVWDAGIAEREAAWASHLAEIGRLEHQPREGRGALRENLAQIPANWDINQAIQLWLDEESDFIPGEFPTVSRSWQPDNVLHYTQMIWFATESIGCGQAESGGFIYVACGYSPGGNRPGEWVGQQAQAEAALPPLIQILTDYRQYFWRELERYEDAKRNGDAGALAPSTGSAISVHKTYRAAWESAKAQGLDVSQFDDPREMARAADAIAGATDPDGYFSNAALPPDLETNVEQPQLPDKEGHKPEPSKEPLEIL